MLNSANPPLPWKPALCSGCPVPGILQANACKYLQLKPEFARPFPFLKQEVRATAYCQKTKRMGFDAHLGCGECHPLPEVFVQIADGPPDQPPPGENR